MQPPPPLCLYTQFVREFLEPHYNISFHKLLLCSCKQHTHQTTKVCYPTRDLGRERSPLIISLPTGWHDSTITFNKC